MELSSMSMIIENDYIREPLPFYGFERILREDSQAKVINLFTTKELYDDLKNTGAVIYRYFNDSLKEFNEIIKKHSSKVTFDPARKAPTSNTAEINAGIFEMGLHQENGNLPFNPDLQWFYCLEAATKGSETISSFCSFYSKLGLGTYIIKNIISMFSARGYEYILLTATDQVKKLIYSLVEEVEILAVADPRKVQNHNINWGTYYTNNPHVIMFKLPSISSKDLKDEAKIA